MDPPTTQAQSKVATSAVTQLIGRKTVLKTQTHLPTLAVPVEDTLADEAVVVDAMVDEAGEAEVAEVDVGADAATAEYKPQLLSPSIGALSLQQLALLKR